MAACTGLIAAEIYAIDNSVTAIQRAQVILYTLELPALYAVLTLNLVGQISADVVAKWLIASRSYLIKIIFEFSRFPLDVGLFKNLIKTLRGLKELRTITLIYDDTIELQNVKAVLEADPDRSEISYRAKDITRWEKLIDSQRDQHSKALLGGYIIRAKLDA